jgi:hypothetical protein
MKGLDSQGTQEVQLKKNLKEGLEEKMTMNENGTEEAKEVSGDSEGNR